MDRILITSLGAIGWGGALVVIILLRSTQRPDRAEMAGLTAGSRMAVAVARVTGTLAGGTLAGMAVLGLGGRLMMRVLAATSSDQAQGRITDAGETVGEITKGGTTGLIIFSGIFGGLLGAGIYGSVRRWLPRRSLVAGAVAAGLGMGLAGRTSGLTDPENPDFAILEPRWLAVLLCVGLMVTFALSAAVLIDRWTAVWPVPSRSPAGIAGLIPLAPVLLIPPAAVLIVVIVLARTWLAGRGDGGIPNAGSQPRRLPDRLARGIVALTALAGAAWTASGAIEILVA